MYRNDNHYWKKTFNTTNVEVVIDDPLQIVDTYITNSPGFLANTFHSTSNSFAAIYNDEKETLELINRLAREYGNMSTRDCLREARKLLRQIQAAILAMSGAGDAIIDAFCEMLFCIASQPNSPLPPRNENESCGDYVQRVAESGTFERIFGKPVLVGGTGGTSLTGPIFKIQPEKLNELAKKYADCSRRYTESLIPYLPKLLEINLLRKKLILLQLYGKCRDKLNDAGCPIGEAAPELTNWERYLIDNGFHWIVNPSSDPQIVASLSSALSLYATETDINNYTTLATVQRQNTQQDSYIDVMNLYNVMLDVIYDRENYFPDTTEQEKCLDSIDTYTASTV